MASPNLELEIGCVAHQNQLTAESDLPFPGANTAVHSGGHVHTVTLRGHVHSLDLSDKLASATSLLLLLHKSIVRVQSRQQLLSISIDCWLSLLTRTRAPARVVL